MFSVQKSSVLLLLNGRFILSFVMVVRRSLGTQGRVHVWGERRVYIGYRTKNWGTIKGHT